MMGCVSLCTEPSAWARTGQPGHHSRTVIPTKTRHLSPMHVRLPFQDGALCLCLLLSLTTHLMEQVTHPFHRRANRGRGHYCWQAKRHHSRQLSVTSKPGCSPCWWLAPDSRGIGSGFFGGVGGDKTPHPRTALTLREAWGRDKRKLMAPDHAPPNPGWKCSEKPKAVD